MNPEQAIRFQLYANPETIGLGRLELDLHEVTAEILIVVGQDLVVAPFKMRLAVTIRPAEPQLHPDGGIFNALGFAPATKRPKIQKKRIWFG